MIGVGFSYLVEQVKSFVARQAVIYGLMAAAGLILIFAAGYGLDAVRGTLMIRVGGVYASLIVGGGLLLLALILLGTALYLRRASSPAAIVDQASSNLPKLPKIPRVTGSSMLAGGAVTGLVAGFLLARRSWRIDESSTASGDDDQFFRPPPR